MIVAYRWRSDTSSLIESVSAHIWMVVSGDRKSWATV